MKLLVTQQETKPKIEFLVGVVCVIGAMAWIAFLHTMNTPVIPYLAIIPTAILCVYTYHK